MKEKKTLKEWFMTLREPYRSESISNTDDLTKVEASLIGALSGAFVWSDSPQGDEYWRDVFRNPEKYTLPIPRMVEVRYFEDDEWVKRELLADLSGAVVSSPYICRSSIISTMSTPWKFMREIEEKKQPMSFSDYAIGQGCEMDDSLDIAYEKYQTYLKNFSE